MGKLEKQQKKLEAMQAKEEKKLEKLREKELRKLEKKEKKNSRKPLVNTPDINFRAEREIEMEKPYEFNPKSTKWKKVLAIFLWVLIAFFAFKGVMSIVNYEDSADIKKNMTKYYEALSGKETVRTTAGSFALNFLNDYYTYDSDENSWVDKTRKYLATGVMLEEPTEIDSESCENIEIRDIVIDDDHIDVTASVTVNFLVSGVSGDDEQMTTKEGRIKYLVKVPIKTDGENYAVLSEPVYVADYNKAQKIEPDEFGTDVDVTLTSEQENILQKTAENFFTAYYGSKPSALSNFVTQNFDSSAVAGGNLKFVRIENFNGIRVRGGYKVKTTIVLNNGLCDVKETVYLKIVKGDQGRFYIDEMTIR